MQKTACLLSFLAFAAPVFSQNLAGAWSGELTQDGQPDIYPFRLDLAQGEGGKLSGTSSSQKKDGTATQFEVGGTWDGSMLVLQEVRQTQPPGGRSCLKHFRLALAEREGAAHLEGPWEAEGCTPGKVVLKKDSLFLPQSPLVIPEGNPIPGRWSGSLSQSDRDYGFYFELNLAADGTGTSGIYSDGEGGSALHRLRWQFDEALGILAFDEVEVAEKSVPDWRWCLKSARLLFKKEESRLALDGGWEGIIEGFTPQTGACAPGRLHLEKPVLKKEEMAKTPAYQGFQPYEKSQGRDVEVERVMEVRSKTVRIRVWDSGTVDGDVLSLFLNGELLLKNYRVTRQKNETIVKLDKPVNYLILHAINLGSISPNTVAVSVDDGVQEQVAIISSNLRTSGAVMIKEFVVGEK